MTAVKLCGCVLIGVIFIVLCMKGKGDIGFFISLAMGVMLAISALDKITPLTEYIKRLTEESESYSAALSLMLKGLGICLVCSFTSGVCKKAGEDNIASGVELFGNAEILILALPTVNSLLEACGKFL